MKILKWIWIYLKDWKNILTHTIIGLLILFTAFYLPIDIFYRIGILVLIVVFNIWRMRRERKRE